MIHRICNVQGVKKKHGKYIKSNIHIQFKVFVLNLNISILLLNTSTLLKREMLDFIPSLHLFDNYICYGQNKIDYLNYDNFGATLLHLIKLLLT